MPVLGGVCSLAHYDVAYEENQSNRVSVFRDFLCSLFQKAILFLRLFYVFLLLKDLSSQKLLSFTITGVTFCVAALTLLSPSFRNGLFHL